MNDGNKNKDKLLEEPHGTANSKLKKSIIFWLAQETGRDICYRCGEKIDTIGELSIEHKDSWMSAKNPAESFYNLNNIAFSHLICNNLAANRHFPHPLQRGESGNKKRARLLGEPHGTATGKLKKLIIFWLVKETKKDICYRCKKIIETINEFSIEHKDSWQRAENPKEAFYSLDNISFSHLKCNRNATNLHSPRPNASGESNGRAKLTWEQVRDIRAKIEEGISLGKLATEYSMGRSSIFSIKKNINWKKD